MNDNLCRSFPVLVQILLFTGKVTGHFLQLDNVNFVTELSSVAAVCILSGH